MLEHQLTLNCKGRLISLEGPLVMGILNVTPDSFFDGGQYTAKKAALNQVEKMMKKGASMIDVGGVSSRPGSDTISETEELERVIPMIRTIAENFPEAIISVDTFRAKVAKESVGAGAAMINDISAGRIDEKMYETVASLTVPYVLMHMQGKPKNMQENPTYEDIVQEVLDFFIWEMEKLRKWDIKDIILDVGFGFGKTIEHNFRLLKDLHVFKILEQPLLVGISRKSMICRLLNIKPEAALNATSALNLVALQQGAKILRVHDVAEAMEVIEVWKQLEAANKK